jgi:hypothetical protein
MTQQLRNVFISHINEDDAELSKLKSLLSTGGCEVRDSSIDSTKPNKAESTDYIKSQILRPRIQWAGTLLVLISPQTHDSEWVNWEIECAAHLGKRIVGVWAQGARDSDVPAALDDYADAVVGWNAASIIDAIDGGTNSWATSSGALRTPRPIKTYDCGRAA